MAARKRAATAATKTRGGKNLVIVESGAKAATLQRFLGSQYKVVASVGHVRDLPASAAQVPKNLKGKSWATLAVNVDEGFRPVYIVPADRKRVVANLRSDLKTARELLIATDEDREGEAIAWHLVEVLKPKLPIRRMVFHEITRSAVEAALGRTRDIDQHLVRAQEARRVLDRLIGYLVSPVLWRKVQSGLSAGRVQTPALRLIVDRERERMAFVHAAYWGLTATLAPSDRPDGAFPARLVSLDGQDIATGDDFDPSTGALLANRRVRRIDEADTRRLATALTKAEFHVVSVDKRPVTRRPAPPFITSTLQQAASRRLRFSARQTMRVAQQLYEAGYITYMRTDSPTLSQQAIAAARDEVERRAGKEYLPEKPRRYRARAARAQEAHEAIRPAGERFRHPAELGTDVDASG
ncbi:MAG: type I DNA topoisomerase, partial [Chloroflexi bacterium]|nr:type I DNA topoisomerase [Chloroflexota bacterium]